MNSKFSLKNIPTCLLFFIGLIGGQNSIAADSSDVQYSSRLAAIEKRLLAFDVTKVNNLNDEERNWYEKFQEGLLFFDGWREISEDVMAKVSEEEKVQVKVTMQSLGVKIGCEWSKDNDIRKISTDMLKNWGKDLRKASKGDSSQQVMLALQSIEYEVDELLALN